MELQFQKQPFDYLHRVVWEIKNEEQTQEVKLAASMPDIGKVLGVWGQPLIRGKEWRGSSMGVSGGVMAWVLYAPEDGSAPRTVDAWIPFQLRWDFPQTQRDGAMRVCCRISAMDARTVSARKLMVRCMLSAGGEALEPVQTDIFQPCELPEDVRILKKSYPIQLPREAGEKTFTLEEAFSLSEPVQRLVRYDLRTDLTEKKIISDKLVFRGTAHLSGFGMKEDGALKEIRCEIPFSQYAELEREYGPDAQPDVILAVTNLEPELEENGTMRMKAGLVGQYVVYDMPVFEVVEDAYSPKRPVELETKQLILPAVLDRLSESLCAQVAAETETLVDAVFTAEHPTCRGEDDQVRMSVPGTFQLVLRDPEGNLQGGAVRWEGELKISAARDTQLLAMTVLKEEPQETGGENAVCCDLRVDMLAVRETEIPMVTALNLGEFSVPDPGRPSLILRRCGHETLWDVAKQCGSTVEAIWDANGLTEEPREDRMLLIPVP